MSRDHNVNNLRGSAKLAVRSALFWLLGMSCALGDFDPLFTAATEDDGQPPKVVFDYKLRPHEEVSKVAVKADGEDVIAKLVSYADDEAKKTAILFLVDTSDARRGMEMLQVQKLIAAALAKAKSEKHNIGVYPFTGQLDMGFAPMGSPLKDVASKVRTLKAEGKNTVLYGSVIKAIAELEKVKADRKALVVISDWQSEDKVWDAKEFTERATKRLKDLRIVCHSIVMVHTEKSELDVAEAITNAMHGKMIKVDPDKVSIPATFVGELYQDLESGGAAEIDLIGREQVRKVVLSVEVQGGKSYTFEHDRSEKVDGLQQPVVKKILEEAGAKLDALVKEGGEAIDQIDKATAEVQAEVTKIADDTTAKITAAADEARKQLDEVKLAQEVAEKAGADLDKLQEDAKLNIQNVVKAVGILQETRAKLDALVKEGEQAIGQIDPATAEVQTEAAKIADDTTAKITEAADESRKQLAEVKLAQEVAEKAGADLDKLQEEARLSIENLANTVAEAPSESKKSKLAALADKKLFGIPMLWVLGPVVAAIIVLIVILIVLSRKKPDHEDLGDFSIDPALESGGAREFDFGNGTAVCRTLPSASETVVAQLLFGDGGKHGMFPVSKAAVRIGRGSDNDLIFKNDSVSRHHAEILCKRDGKVVITDLDSGNGVVINGMQVAQQELRSGDSVEVGEVCFTFSKQS